MTNNKILQSSFRDPSGFLFTNQNKLYRQINQVYQKDYSELVESGLYDKLTGLNYLIPHVEVDIDPPLGAEAFKIIQPEQIDFISYPYEWSFSQLKDAALLMLAIQKIAVKYGMSLKDSSAYNIQFHPDNCKPILIDTLSFERYKEGQPWVAYRQYCQHFLAPLALMSLTDVRLSQLLRIHIDGIPLDLTSQLLPQKSKLDFGLLSHIHLHAAAQKRFANQTPTQNMGARQMSKNSYLGLIDNLERTTKKLTWTPTGTEWGDYYQDTNYNDQSFEHKKTIVKDFLEFINVKSVWDLGANTGVFSRLASQKGIATIAFDIDPAAVEKNYLGIKADLEHNLVPLVLDLTNPSPAIGWRNQERLSISQRKTPDAVIALALVHHLAISNNVPLSSIAEYFRDLAPWLIIEFVPKNDSQVQKLLATREDIFPQYSVKGFEKVINNYFEIEKIERTEEPERYIYLLRRKY